MWLWYLRRAVPWAALLGCTAAATVLVAAAHRWPAASAVLLPYALGCCAAAAGFVMDEGGVAVVAVTARGGSWRVLARLAAVSAPVLTWALLVTTLPDQATTRRTALALAGAAGCLLSAGAAAALARAGTERPGGHVASVLVGVVTVPFVLGGLLGWAPLYPVGSTPAWVEGLWWSVAAVGLLLAVAGLRRTPRRRRVTPSGAPGGLGHRGAG